MTLSKVDLEVAKYYVDTLGSRENRESFDVIFEVISKEYNLTKSLILEITGKNMLLESDRDLKSSVNLRNKTIIPLGFLQVSLLRRLRDQTRQPPISEFLIDNDESTRAYSRSELLRGALLTINGIAAGMRNTGWKLQYFSKTKLVLPEGYFVNSSKIPLAKEVNKLLANCGSETFPIKPLSEAIQKSNFFFTIQNEIKNKLYGFVRVTSDRGLNANLWNLSAVTGNNQNLFYSILLQVTLEKINREMPGCSISVQAPLSSLKSIEQSGFIIDPNGIRVMGYKL